MMRQMGMPTANKTENIDRNSKEVDDLSKAVMLIMLFPILYFCCCTRVIDRQEAVGIYHGNQDIADDSLIIKDNGSFELFSHPHDTSSSYYAEGKWLFVGHEHNQTLILIYDHIECSINPANYPCHSNILATTIGGGALGFPVYAYTNSNDIEIVIGECSLMFIKKGSANK